MNEKYQMEADSTTHFTFLVMLFNLKLINPRRCSKTKPSLYCLATIGE